MTTFRIVQAAPLFKTGACTRPFMNHKHKLSVLRLALASTFALGASLSGVNAYAATATAPLGVTATVSNNCSISTAPVAFGPYDPVTANASVNIDLNGTVSVTCTAGASTVVTLGQGANADTGSTDAVPVRRMKDAGTNFLTYSLFQQTGRTTVWGNTEGTGVAHTGTGTLTAITVFGRLNAGQNVPAGAYTDTVVATITF